MQKFRVARGFHRVGMAVSIPLLVASFASAILSLGLLTFPNQVSSLLGFDALDNKVTTPTSDSFRLSKILEEERSGTLTSERKALLDEARRRNLIPTKVITDLSRSESMSGAITGGFFAVAFVALAAVWYGLMRAFAWIIEGFIGDK